MCVLGRWNGEAGRRGKGRSVRERREGKGKVREEDWMMIEKKKNVKEKMDRKEEKDGERKKRSKFGPKKREWI